MKSGLNKQKRNYVHLSKDTETAIKVGSRRGKPIILIISAKKMYDDGYEFLISENVSFSLVPTDFIISLLILCPKDLKISSSSSVW